MNLLLLLGKVKIYCFGMCSSLGKQNLRKRQLETAAIEEEKNVEMKVKRKIALTVL